MDIKIIVEFIVKNACTKEDLEDLTALAMAEYLIFEEGICGVVDIDTCKLIKAEEIEGAND